MNYEDKKSTELELWKQWQKKDPTALPQLITSLNPLIQNQVNRFVISNIPRPALESEARRLTVDALNTYDPEKAQLNTHITNHLKHLQRYVLQYQNIGKIPEHRGIKIGTFQTQKQELFDELGREPNTVELSDRLQWPPSEVERMELELRKDLNITTGSGEEDETDTFFDKDYSQIDKTKDLIMMYYYSASQEEKLILEYSFGIGGKIRKGVSDIAKTLKMSEDKVRNIRAKIAESINETMRFYGNT